MDAYLETADIETSSENYARRFSGKVGAWFLDVQNAATLKALAPYPGATVLDVGGGHAQTAGLLADQGYQVTVLGSAEICKTRLQPLIDSQRCVFQVGDILNLPYPDRHFDVVISYRLLPHVTRWQPFLAELTRVARKAVMVDYPEVRSINAITPYLFGLKKRLEGNTRTYTCFRLADLRPVFEENGFAYAEHHKEFFLPMVLHRKLKAPGLSAVLEKGSQLLGLTGLLGSPVIIKLVREEN